MNKYVPRAFLLAIPLVIGVFLLATLRSEVGELVLPHTTGELSEKNIDLMLLGITTKNINKLRLNERDKTSLLVFLRQMISMVELPGAADVYISDNATVWKILALNFREFEIWMVASASKFDDSISFKSAAKVIQNLQP